VLLHRAGDVDSDSQGNYLLPCFGDTFSFAWILQKTANRKLVGYVARLKGLRLLRIMEKKEKAGLLPSQVKVRNSIFAVYSNSCTYIHFKTPTHTNI
jgi:hypothetical protein